MNLFEFEKRSVAKVEERSTKAKWEGNLKIPEKKKVRFVHLGDVHLWAFRAQHEKLRKVSMEILKMVFEFCEKYNVDFILISGDLFHTPSPPLELQKECAALLTKADENGIRVYVVYGSHDGSPQSTSSIDVLAATKRIRRVDRLMKTESGFSISPVEDNSGVWIVGMWGRKGGTEVSEMERLDFESLERIPKPKIFMLHSAITEFRPEFLKEEEGVPLSLIPPNFDYYACGHIHKRMVHFKDGYGLFVYPGALFGSSVKDLEEATEQLPGFFLVDFDGNSITEQSLTFIDVYSLQAMLGKEEIPHILFVEFFFDQTTPSEITDEIKRWAKEKELTNTIVYIKINAKIVNGKRYQIDIEEIARVLKARGAIDVLANREGVVEEAERKFSFEAEEGLEESKIVEKILGEVFSQKQDFAKEVLEILGVEMERSEMEGNVKKAFGL